MIKDFTTSITQTNELMINCGKLCGNLKKNGSGCDFISVHFKPPKHTMTKDRLDDMHVI